MFKLLYKSSVSACFEMQNDLIYFNDLDYEVLLDGQKQGVKQKTNIFSVFNLTPNTKYKVETTLGGRLEFVTNDETMAISVKDFGAVGDGVSDDTHAFQTAINLCQRNGRVVVPKGTYFVSPLVLKSNMTLEIKKDAKILANCNAKDYNIIPGEVPCVYGADVQQCASWEGNPVSCYQSIISAHHADNIAIVGEGELDGNGHNGTWWHDYKNLPHGRPRLVFFNDCDGFVLHGITASNSPAWTIHPYFSRNVSVLDVKINAGKDTPNTDGCNPESCKDVQIIGAVFSVGDDCIAIKSGKIYMGKKYKTPSDGIVIRNCLMQFGHGGVVLGSEIAGGVKNLTVNRCLFRQTDRGLRIKTRRGRGEDSRIDNVLFESVRMENVLAPLVMNMYYFCCDPDGKSEYVYCKDATKYPVDDRTPYLGRFHFKDIECVDVEQAGGFFYGLPEQPIEEVFIENVSFKTKADAKAGMPAMMTDAKVCLKEGLYFNFVKKVRLKNVSFKDVKGKEVELLNVESFVNEDN